DSCRNNADCSLPSGSKLVRERVTQVTSHEFSEMVTDPEINAWRDASNGAEIGDICNGEKAEINGWTVQQVYSYYDDVNYGRPCMASSDVPLPDLRAPYQKLILSTTIPLDATGFDFVVADYNGDGKPDLFCLKNTGTGSLEIQVLSHASNYQ